ncbi:hypothetical protein [uncultured Psychroserpens sp.]|uniref:hypothetical protein n=1 Tax=uncultured Psychroserpens sp. TaxID=255436 RepID=UPI002637BE5D|nr:hypothetical protein [uncultured Psychroserpens sp.]
MYKKYSIATVISMVCLCFVYGQNNDDKMLAHFNAADYSACIDVCDSILTVDKANAKANFFKGASLIRTKNYNTAEAYMLKAKENNFQPAVFVNSNLLRMYAGQQKSELVLRQLNEMVSNGFNSMAVLKTEEFDYLNDNKEFENLRSKVDASANPCKYGAEYKKLDFWLGEWDVYVKGKKTADSYITKSEGGCTLHEDYRTLGGYFGRSMNYYDAADQLYTQIWIDKNNGKIEFKETSAKEGYLMMMSDQGDGNLIRMSYEKDNETGNVTQIMESSSDEGKTWNLNFNGVYKLKKTN